MMKSLDSCSHESSPEYFRLRAPLLNTVHTSFYCFGSVVDWNLIKPRHLVNCSFYFSEAVFLTPWNLLIIIKLSSSYIPDGIWTIVYHGQTEVHTMKEWRLLVIPKLFWNIECTFWPCSKYYDLGPWLWVSLHLVNRVNNSPLQWELNKNVPMCLLWLSYR